MQINNDKAILETKISLDEILLASASPRRKEIIHLLGVPVKIIPSSIDESFQTNLNINDNLLRIADNKTKDASNEQNLYSTIIGADTVVVLNDIVYGKPKNNEDAKRTLLSLSGTKHEVITGVSILNRARNINITFTEKTTVHFRELSEQEIHGYVMSSEPMDKAGSYAIQGKAALFVSKIEGSYLNVVGLPINRIYNELKKHFILNPFTSGD